MNIAANYGSSFSQLKLLYAQSVRFLKITFQRDGILSHQDISENMKLLKMFQRTRA